MTDEEEDGHEIDGWVVMHDGGHRDTEGPYGFGPFPTPDIAEYIRANAPCPCTKSVVPVFFPKGVRLMVEVETAVGFEQRSDRMN